jgi:predicted Zn-dependent peptidase
MKRILIALSLVASVAASAQIDRSIRPTAAPARTPTIAQYQKFQLKNGLTVLLVEDHKLPRISLSLSMDVGQVLEGEKSGTVSLLGDLLSEGTKAYSKEALDEKVDFIGARLSTGGTSLGAAGLSKYAEDLFALSAEVAQRPTLPQSGFDKIKERTLSGLKSQKDDPAAIQSNIFNARVFGANHPNGELTTEASVANVTLADCKKAYSKYWKPNIAVLTIVGDIDLARAKALAETHYGGWKGQFTKNASFPAPADLSGIQIQVANRPSSVQSNIQIGNTIELPIGHPDLEALRVMNEVLGAGSAGRLFRNLREDKAYTYGAYSSFGTSRYTTVIEASAEVRNAVTDSAVEQFLFEINRIRTESVTDEELRSAKNNLAGGFGRSLERPETVASMAGNTLLYNLPADYYNGYLTRLEAVTAQDVQRVAQKYWKSDKLLISVVGKAADIAKPLQRLGYPVSYVSFEGQPTEAPKFDAVPAGLTAAKVIESALQAMGGIERINALQSVNWKQEASIMGITINSEVAFTAPSTLIQKQTSPMGASETRYEGDNVTVMQNGAAKELSADEKAELMADRFLIDELGLLTRTDLKLQETKVDVNGEACYAIEIPKAGSDPVVKLYSIATALRIREARTQEGPQGKAVVNVDYSDYREVGGVKFPHEMKVPLQPGMDLIFKTTALDVK